MPSRKERQATTRKRLMQAAAGVFCRKGLDRASIDDVAGDAGFTKGAFYANFRNKEELFLAMLDERFNERVQELDSAMGSGDDPEQQLRQAGADFVRYVRAEREWERLFFEFAAYAARNEDFRQELVTRYRTLRERMAEVFRRRAEQLGGELPIPAEHLAMMTFVMANGVALEELLEPGSLPEDLYPTMVGLMFAGLTSAAPSDAPAPR
jgi:AcrR family transcriptional regulator